MSTGSKFCFPNESETRGQGSHMYGNQEFNQDVLSMNETSAEFDTQSASLLCNLSLLKDKVQQVQSLVGDGARMFLNHSQTTAQSTAVAMGSMSTLLQEIIIAASSMMFTCQQISLRASQSKAHASNYLTVDKLNDGLILSQHNYGDSTTLDWYGENYNNTACYTSKNISEGSLSLLMVDKSERLSTSKDCDIIEMDAADLLAKYTHYCQICGKGFKRDANLRMHMRAHGEEYKSSAALSNPMKKVEGSNGNGDDVPKIARKYSCPQEGCRWNKKHAKFHPLKSMICAKNHYKRSHCPKMYVCKRCNRKQFSVLSDLRTHEKHCGDLKWQCSCGTTFSRKDKLLGHVALFHGHTPAFNSSYNRSTINIVLDDSML